MDPDWEHYHHIVVTTWASTPGEAMDDPRQRGAHLGLALMAEAGEAGEIIKKAHRISADCERLDDRELLSELGDVLWAITSIACWRGHSLEDVRRANVNKMLTRHARLFQGWQE